MLGVFYRQKRVQWIQEIARRQLRTLDSLKRPVQGGIVFRFFPIRYGRARFDPIANCHDLRQAERRTFRRHAHIRIIMS